jgi:putative ABC transport system substrate-binding protein
MNRREFITLLGGVVAAWPVAGQAQQADGAARKMLGVLSGSAENDPNNQAWFSAFDAELRNLGWKEGQNIHVERRFAPGSLDQMQAYAKELVELRPDLLFVTNTPSTAALLNYTRSIPIVFANLSDPLGNGIVSSLAKPGGNATGFTNFEFTTGGKWLQLLKDMAPGVTRTAVIFNPELAPFAQGYIRSVQMAAGSFAVTSIPAPIRELSLMIELEQTPGGSIVVIPDASTVPNRARIISLSARYRLPAVWPTWCAARSR